MKLSLLILCTSIVIILQGCIKQPEFSTRTRPALPVTPLLTIENKVECEQPNSVNIIECEENGQLKKYCNKLTNNTNRIRDFDVYINSQYTDTKGGVIFNIGKSDSVEVGGDTTAECSYFSKCSSDGPTINDSSVYVEVIDKKLKDTQITNNTTCILEGYSNVISCPRSGVQYKQCNLIENTNDIPVIVSLNVEVSHVNDAGTEVYKRAYLDNIPIGPKSVYQMSYFSKCDVDNDLDEVRNAKLVKVIKDKSYISSEKKATSKEKSKQDVIDLQGIRLFEPPLPVGRCSLECDFNNPQSHCFITTLAVTKDERELYQKGLSKLNSLFSKQEEIEPETLLESLGVKVNSSCDISTFEFNNGSYIADGNNCGFKTQMLPGLDLAGNWEKHLSMKSSSDDKNQVVLMFDSGPYIWFEGKDTERVSNINKTLAGDLLELEMTQNGIYLSLPNACLVSRIIEK